MFYGADTKFCYNACQTIEAEGVKIGKCIHYKMYEYGEERRVKVWVLDHKGEKYLHIFQLMAMNLSPTQYTGFMDVTGKGILLWKIVQKDKRWDLKIHGRLIGL